MLPGAVTVTVWKAAGRPVMTIGRSGAAAMAFPARSETAPASISSCGNLSASAAARWDDVSVTVRVLPETEADAPVRAVPPEDSPDPRTCRSPRSTVDPSASLNDTSRMPVSTEYAADINSGGAVSAGTTSRTVTVTVSVAVSVPSVTVSVKVKSVSAVTSGAVKLAVRAVLSLMVMEGVAGEVWVQA